jgi:hypothetical protein
VNKTKIFLLLANLAVGLFIYFSFNPEEENIYDISSRMIETIQTLERIEISTGEVEKDLVIQKTEENWMLISPINWKAEGLLISNLTTKLVHSNPLFVIDCKDLEARGEILEDYGINQNSTTIRLQGNNRELSITLGKETRDESSIFVVFSENGKNTEEAIWKMSKDIVNLSTPSSVFWSKSTFLNTPLYGIDQINITEFHDQKEKQIILSKNEEEAWYFEKPYAEAANNELINIALNKILSSRIDNFIDLKDIKGDLIPILIFEIKGLGYSEKVDLHVTKSLDHLYCKKSKSDTYFSTELENLKVMQNWQSKYREKKIFKNSKDQILSLSIKSGSKSYRVHKSELNNWIIEHNSSGEIIKYKGDQLIVDDFINKLYNIQIEEILVEGNDVRNDDTENDLNSFSYSIKYTDNNFTNITIINDNSSDKYFKSFLNHSTNRSYISIPDNNIFCKNRYYFKNKILNTLISTKDSIKVTYIDQNRSVIFSDSNSTNNLLFNSKFRVKEYLNDPFQTSGVWNSGDWNPWEFKIDLIDETNSTNFELLLSDKKDSGEWFGGIPDQNQTFILDEKVSNLIQTKFIDVGIVELDE